MAATSFWCRTMLSKEMSWAASVKFAGFALASRGWHAWALLVGYGVYHGLTEPSEKALLRDLDVPRGRRQAREGRDDDAQHPVRQRVLVDLVAERSEDEQPEDRRHHLGGEEPHGRRHAG